MKNLNLLTDEELVALYSEGDNGAFDVLLLRHKNRIYSYVFYIVKDRELAEDIFQETFVKVITTIKQGRYVESGKFSSWITRIAHNLIIDHYRQEKSENHIQNSDMTPDVFNRKELSEGTVEDSMISSQVRVDIRKLVAALPDNQKEVLVMRYYKNMSFKEIADATNVSINTALGRMRYAILNMRRLAEENKVELFF
ncbi:MAG: sigma-70 family RNA polymerase sigma factor [Bacteroidales bacterium]|nr:sigma-70 family RNA polymerase sigma factor [Bacteroidales bacterium]MBR5531847.1 sigma-70 family RNA polymerase sigma factor [Bacteroidales bacterium]